MGVRTVRPDLNFQNFNAWTVRSIVRSFLSVQPEQSNSGHLLLGVPWTLSEKFKSLV